MNERLQQVVAFLKRDEVDFLDKLGKDAFFSCGHKASRTQIIAWMVDLLRGLGVSGEDIISEQDLKERIARAMMRLHKKT